MADVSLVARSPIAPAPPEVLVAGWAVSGRASDASLRLTDCTPLAKVKVRAPEGGLVSRLLGVPRGTSSLRRKERDGPAGLGDADVLVVGSGPGEWVVLGPPGRGPEMVSRLGERARSVDELVTVVDLTHGRALMRLTGARCADVLAKECGVPLTETACPTGAALRTAVAGVAVDIVRDDRDEILSYLMHCERSSGQYLWDVLLDAGAEWAIDVTGFVAPGI